MSSDKALNRTTAKMIEDFEKKTWMNYWPEELWALREQEPKKIDISKYAMALVEHAYGDPKHEVLYDLEQEIKPFFEGMPKFIRLNRRSPKDWTQGKPVHDAIDAIKALYCSMRTVDDLAYMNMNGEPSWLYIFNYSGEVQEKEFRCFVKDGKLIAITQYEGTKFKGFPEDDPEKVICAVKTLWPSIRAAVDLKDFVFDVFLLTDFSKDSRPEIARFLEINPYGLSDTCFFKSYEEVERGGFAFQKTEILPIF